MMPARYLDQTGKEVFDFHSTDVFWCTADPGWITGTSYGIVAPLVHGTTSIVNREAFDVRRWYRILAQEKVSVWYTSPLAIRRLMHAEIAPRDTYDLGALRLICSVGEPLRAGAVHWAEVTPLRGCRLSIPGGKPRPAGSSFQLPPPRRLVPDRWGG